MGKPMTPEEVVDWIEKSSKYYAKIELTELCGKLHMTAYTGDDMW